MKMPGLQAPINNVVPIIFQRPGDVFIEFKVKPVDTFEPFYKLCPEKKPAWTMNAMGEKKYDFESKEYKAYQEERSKKFDAWLVLHSITEPSEIVWDTVDFDDPETFCNWETEMTAMGIGAGERRHIINAVAEVNSINENVVTKAFSNFLSMVRAAAAREKEELSRQIAQVNTQSSESASDSDSFPQESES